MPPRRRKHQQRSNIEQSDYDSEAYQTDIPYPHAQTSFHPPVRTNEELNLSVLKRHYCDIHQILHVAPFAVIYSFNPESQTWEKSGTEGALFVCQLLPSTALEEGSSLLIERYSVVILNRKGLDNFFTELFSTADIEITEEYVILQVTDPETDIPQILGLWISSEADTSTAQTREISAKIIMECADRAEKSQYVAEDVAESYDQAYESSREQEYIDQHNHGAHGGYGNQSKHQPDGRSAQVPPVPMPGQQISVGNLFGQPSGQAFLAQPQRSQHYAGSPQYGGHPMNGQPASSQPAEADMLLNLFRSARAA